MNDSQAKPTSRLKSPRPNSGRPGSYVSGRVLGIDWDHHQLRLVEAVLKAGKVQVLRAACWAETVDPNPAQAEEAGRRLKERLKQLGIAPAPVIFAIGRDRVIFREVNYPDVPAVEVPIIINFQVAKELSFPASEATIDYVPSSVPGPNGTKRALAVVLHRDLEMAIKRAMHVAGLRLAGLSARPFGSIASVLTHADNAGTPPNRVVALVTMVPGGGELSIARSNEVLFSRPIGASVNGTTPAQTAPFLPELRRSLAAYATQFPQQPVECVYVAGDSPALEKESLTSSLRLTITPFDPLAGVAFKEVALADRGGFAGIMGLLQAHAARRAVPVNFLAPKQAEPPRKRTPYLIAAAVAAVVLLGAVGIGYSSVSRAKQAEIDDLQARKLALQKQIKAFDETEKRLEGITNWAGAEMVLLDELYELVARFPDLTGIRITRVSWTQAPQPLAASTPTRVQPVAKPAANTLAAAKPIGQVEVDISSDSTDGLEKLRQALESNRHWKLDHWDRDKPAMGQVRATFKVFRQKPDEYESVLQPTVNQSAASPSSDSGRGPPSGRPGGGR